MSSTQDYSTSATPTEKSDELVEPQQKLREQQHREPQASSSTSEVLRVDQPPQPPSKDHDVERRLSGDPTLRDSTPPRFSQVIDFNAAPQNTLTAAAELITGNVHRQDVPMPNMTNAGSLTGTNHPIITGPDSPTNSNAGGSNNGNTNPTGARPSSTIHHHPESQTFSPSRPLSPERRSAGPGLTSYDPIRGDSRLQVYLPDTNGSGEGDPAGVSSRAGNRTTAGRTGIQRPRSAFNPTDGTLIGGVPGSRRVSRLMSGQDWLPDVPIIEEPPVSIFIPCPSMWDGALNVWLAEREDR